MPFTDGVFANVTGATNAAAGDVIQSAVWNAIHSDYSDALNMLMGQLTTTPTNRNIAWMNGGFEIWQKGNNGSVGVPTINVSASAVQYTADRWYLATGANQSCTVTGTTGIVDESQLCARVQRDSGQTGTGDLVFAYPLDTDEIIRLRGNIANLSFRVRAGANWSPTNGTLSYRLYLGTGTSPAKRNATPYTGETTSITGSVNITTTTVLVQASGAAIVPTTTTQAEIQLVWTPTGTAGANDYFEIDDLQLEASLSPDTFTLTSYDRLDFKAMLEGCKRFYQKTLPYNNGPFAGSGVTASPLMFISQAAGINGAFWALIPELRTDAPLTRFAAFTATSSAWFSTSNSAPYTATVQASGPKGFFVQSSAIASAGNIYTIHGEVSAGI